MRGTFVAASETEQGKGWNEARLKLLTGGDPIRARLMRQITYR
jgi:putative DNA primase/helicase